MNNTVLRRMLDLVGKIVSGETLTPSEQGELRESHKYLTLKTQQYIDLVSLSYLAAVTDDYDWQSEICSELDKLAIF